MEIAGVDIVDWTAPWLEPISALGQALCARVDWRSELNRAAAQRCVRNNAGQGIVFVESGAAAEQAYETFIARTGCVPTRSNLHDFFNALMFLHYPESKAQLNWLQATAIERDGVQAVRGAVRDAATVIDENAILLVTQRADLVDALRAHDWTELFTRQRAAWDDEVVVRVFGHALLEKLVRPYKAITAHALHIPLSPRASITEIDCHFASMLVDCVSRPQLMPLPVLGIPGWYAANARPDFYRDDQVFRPVNMRRPATQENRSNETRRT